MIMKPILVMTRPPKQHQDRLKADWAGIRLCEQSLIDGGALQRAKAHPAWPSRTKDCCCSSKSWIGAPPNPPSNSTNVLV